MTREKLGSFWTDTALMLIGDPCRFIKDKGEVPEYAYVPLLESLWPSMTMTAYSARTTPEGTGMLVQVECDGFYPVYLVRNARGEPVRLEIELGGRAEP